MKDVPRPLLILVIVIILIGVVACGAGVIRGRMDAAGPSPTPSTRFDGFGDSTVPPKDVKIEPDGGSCSASTGDPVTVGISGHCLMTINPRSLLPRRLQLTAGGDVTVTVTQKIRGEDHSKDKGFSDGQTIEASVAGTSPVRVAFDCVSCSVTFPSFPP